VVSIGVSTVFQCDGAGWVVAAHRVVMDTLCFRLSCTRGSTLLVGTIPQAHLLLSLNNGKPIHNATTNKTVNVSTRFSKDTDRYLTEIISYIGERVASKTDEINFQFQ